MLNCLRGNHTAHKKWGDIILSIGINKACGLDIHKRFLIATILGRSDEIAQKRFERNDQGILDLKSWVIEKQCDVVACESTSDFWVPIYDSLISHVTVILKSD